VYAIARFLSVARVNSALGEEVVVVWRERGGKNKEREIERAGVDGVL
jgi:hypothetical protein